MNPILFDLLPVLLFFIIFKYKGIYAATWAGIISTIIQTAIYRLMKKRWDKMQVVTLLIFIIFGGMTLYFHNPIFVKWKPTVIFWVFALTLAGSHFIGSKPIMQYILENALNNTKNKQEQFPLPARTGAQLNLAWVLFFLSLGSLNIYVAYHFNDNIWVNFKLYGITTATLIFSLLQTLFLMRHIKIQDQEDKRKEGLSN